MDSLLSLVSALEEPHAHVPPQLSDPLHGTPPHRGSQLELEGSVVAVVSPVDASSLVELEASTREVSEVDVSDPPPLPCSSDVERSKLSDDELLAASALDSPDVACVDVSCEALW